MVKTVSIRNLPAIYLTRDLYAPVPKEEQLTIQEVKERKLIRYRAWTKRRREQMAENSVRKITKKL